MRAVLDAAGDLLAVEREADLPAAILDAVAGLVPSDLISYNEIDVRRGRARILTRGPEPDPELAQIFAQRAVENPLLAYQETTGDRRPVRLSDFIGARELHRRPIYQLVYRHLGVELQVAFGVSGPAAGVTGIALSRGPGAHDFTDRELAMLDLLRPMLEQLQAGWRVRAGHAAAGPAIDRLTARQRDVVSLLSQGATNREIAQRLVLSERTVAKHLEHVYRALGVSNRTAAAAKLRDSAY